MRAGRALCRRFSLHNRGGEQALRFAIVLAARAVMHRGLIRVLFHRQGLKIHMGTSPFTGREVGHDENEKTNGL